MRIIQPLVGTLEKWCSINSYSAGLYSLPYRKTVQREIDLAGITSADRVLNIGCGAVPFTAVYLSLLSGAEVYALDLDREAVKRARAYLEKIELPGKIQVVEGDGALFPSLDFTAVVVALQAEPKEDILNNLFSGSLPGSRFIFRQPSSFYEHHYDYLPDSYKPVAQVQQNMKTFDRSLLFVKGKEGLS